MQNEKYLELDALAAPNGYVAPPMKTPLQSEPAWVGHSGAFLIFSVFSVRLRLAWRKASWT